MKANTKALFCTFILFVHIFNKGFAQQLKSHNTFTTQEVDAMSSYVDATKWYINDKLEQAQVTMDTFMQKKQFHPSGFYTLSKIAKARGNEDQAFDFAKKAVHYDQDNPWFVDWFVKLLDEKSLYEQAYQLIEKVKTNNLKDSYWWKSNATRLMKLEQYKRTVSYIDSFQIINGFDQQMLFLQAESLILDKNPQKAISLLIQKELYVQDKSKYFELLSSAYEKTSNNTEALNCLQESELNGDLSEAKRQKIKTLQQIVKSKVVNMGEIDMAQLEIDVKNNPNTFSYFQLLAEAYLINNHWKDLEKLCIKASYRFPNQPQVYFFQALSILLDKKDIAKTQSLYEEAIFNHLDDNDKIFYNYSVSIFAQKQTVELEQESKWTKKYQRFLAHEWAGDKFFIDGNRIKAIEYYTKAIEVLPVQRLKDKLTNL